MDNDKKKPLEEQAEITSGITAGLIDVDIAQEVRSAFLDYSMSVIVARAIPDVRDGLKPVHRRIIYGMNELGMQPDKPYKKCARIVGDVMGKFHPHGDQAIYSTLVRLAQPFSMRYPLVDGHGNFGSVDGDEAAAMRYTEARMAKMAMEMVRDINNDTVNFVDNYDGTEKEPVVLPARFPNLLVNGSSGIAVGMATNMPPHNLREVVGAIKAVVANPDVTVLELMGTHLPGPDFPTGGFILGKGGIRQAYETGTGSITIRSRAEIIEKDNGKKQIIISEFPYQVNKAATIEAIAMLVKEKKLEGITDIRDESNKEGIRVVIELKRDVLPDVLLNQLFKHTQLQVNFGIINLSLVNGQPKVLPLIPMLRHYLDHQVEVVERRTQFLLRKAEERAHIVSGYLIAIEAIDEVVAIIRGSDSVDTAKTRLIERFILSERQTKEIVDMPLRRLTGMEKLKLQEEKTDLEGKIRSYNAILADRELVIATIISELDEIAAKFGNERVTEISNDVSTIDDEDLIPREDIVVTLTDNGYIKRMAPDTFKTQNRGGKGVKGMTTNDKDNVSIMLNAHTHSDILFFTNLGRVYRIRGYQIPEYQRTAKGLPIINLINIEQNERVMAVITVYDYLPNHTLLFVTKKGLVKRTAIAAFELINKNGKIAIDLRDGDQLLDVKHTDGEAHVGIASSKGKMIKFHEKEVRITGRDTMGVKAMNVDGGEVIGITTSQDGANVLVMTEHGFGKMSPFDEYRITGRGAKGVLTIKATSRNGNIVAMRAVDGDEDLLVITTGGIVIRVPLTQVRIASRATMGVRVIKLDDNQAVSSIAVVTPEETLEEDNDEEPNDTSISDEE